MDLGQCGARESSSQKCQLIWALVVWRFPPVVRVKGKEGRKRLLGRATGNKDGGAQGTEWHPGTRS